MSRAPSPTPPIEVDAGGLGLDYFRGEDFAIGRIAKDFGLREDMPLAALYERLEDIQAR